MFCHHCGTALPPGAQYCPHCGKTVLTEDPKGFTGNTNHTPSPGAVSVGPTAQAAEGPQIRPWVRYWARLLDIMVFAFPAGMVLGVLSPELVMSDEPGNEWVLGLMILLGWAFVEPLCLSVFGTTPGKALFRIQLLYRGSPKMGYGDALTRSLKVWLRGWGLGLPLVSLITLIVAYRRLTQLGQTSWDEDSGFEVVHRPVGFGRALAAVGLLGLCWVVIVASGT